MTSPTLSVVIPVLNGARDVGACLDSIRRQVPPEGGYEIVLADGWYDFRAKYSDGGMQLQVPARISAEAAARSGI